jgi:hypothetical protein
VFHKSLLKGVKPFWTAQPAEGARMFFFLLGSRRRKFSGDSFDRHNRFPIRALRGIVAGQNRLTIYENCTRAALGFIAANLCARETESIAKQVREHLARKRRKSMLFAIYGKIYV